MGKDVLQLMDDENEQKKFLGFVFGEDLYFYKDILEGMTIEEQIRFIENEPDFMPKDYDRMYSSNSLYSDSVRRESKISRDIKSDIVKSTEFRTIMRVPIKKADINLVKK